MLVRGATSVASELDRFQNEHLDDNEIIPYPLLALAKLW